MVMMSLSSFLHAVFCFPTFPTTFLIVLIYLTTFLSLYFADHLGSVPGIAKQHAYGLSLDEAYRDLHLIATRPHPYNSRENDRVRSYLLNRVSAIAENHNHMTVLDDSKTSVSFIDGAHAAYFEGNNILVKIDGHDENSKANGVLFSAHFDSVSTGPGATDNGMSVSALLQMIKYLATHRPRRTAVFNINNGEEDGLHGAHAFLEHPWSNLTSTFLNFEGAGAGGRPLLFRTTSLVELQAFRNVPHPHANALTADAFARGVVRSETDYAVYSGPKGTYGPHTNQNNTETSAYKGPGGGMRGADVAFYRRRAKYHTPDDSVRSMGRDGGRRALWAMMELVRGAGDTLLNADTQNEDAGDIVSEKEGVVYFDLFASYLIAFPLRLLLAADIVLLAGGPLVIAILAFSLSRQSILARQAQPEKRWIDGLRGYGRFPFALVLTIGAQVGLVVGYIKLNSYTIHAHALATTLSMFSLSYLTLAIPLSLAEKVRPVTPARQKFIVLFELYTLTWVLLLGATVLIQHTNITGLYWVGAWNACALLAVMISSAEGLIGTGKAGRELRIPATSAGDDVDVQGEGSGAVPDDSSGDTRHHSGEGVGGDMPEELDTSETTPLIRHRASAILKSEQILDEGTQDRAFFWWISEVMLSLPIPAVLLGALAFLWTGAMSQTVVDGGWVGTVYAPLSMLSVLVLIPLSPFAHKLHRSLTLLVLVVFAATTAYAWLIWPFDSDGARCKMFFSSRVELANLSVSAGGLAQSPGSANELYRPAVVRAITELTGVAPYVELAVKELPSSWRSKHIHCEDNSLRNGQRTCSWEVDQSLLPAPSDLSYLRCTTKDNHTTFNRCEGIQEEMGPKQAWIYFNGTRIDGSSARFVVHGTNTRACRIHLDGLDIKRYRVLSSELSSPGTRKENTDWHEYEIPGDVSVREVRLWSREWERTFHVEIEWEENGKVDEIGGSVACSWAEHQGGWITGVAHGLHDGLKLYGDETMGARIPALEEALTFVPEWATLTKLRDGLVDAVVGFKL